MRQENVRWVTKTKVNQNCSNKALFLNRMVHSENIQQKLVLEEKNVFILLIHIVTRK